MGDHHPFRELQRTIGHVCGQDFERMRPRSGHQPVFRYEPGSGEQLVSQFHDESLFMQLVAITRRRYSYATRGSRHTST